MKKLFLGKLLLLCLLSMSLSAQQKSPRKSSVNETIVYTCKMHSDVSSTTPGKCPVCGMALHKGKQKNRGDEDRMAYSCPMHPKMKSEHADKCPKCGMTMTLHQEEEKGKKSDDEKKAKKEGWEKFTCPMHPDVHSDKPGNCPKCGMKMKHEHQVEHKES